MTLDDARHFYPRLGFAVYAYDPAGVVTVEVHDPDGNILVAAASTEREALTALLGPAESAMTEFD